MHILTLGFILSCCCLLLRGTPGNAAEVRTQSLIDLHEENWQMMLKGEWMVEFFAPWCPACKSLAPTWERFATNAIGLGVNVAKIDVTTSPSLSGRFFVTALPTIYHVKDGEFRQYRGSRDGDALMQYIKLKQWQKTEPISAWKKPDTIHMSILSYFFKLSHTLKDFNSRLQEEYGLPTWGSYALFAIATIFVGAALGLILVCVVDFLLPPKKTQRQSFSETKERTDLNGVEDIANDEIEDEEGERIADGDDEDITGDSEGEDDDEEDVSQEEEAAEKGEAAADEHSESEAPESDKKVNKKVTEQTTEAAEEKVQKKQSADKLDEVAAGIAEATGANNAVTTTTTAEVRKRKPRKAD